MANIILARLFPEIEKVFKDETAPVSSPVVYYKPEPLRGTDMLFPVGRARRNGRQTDASARLKDILERHATAGNLSAMDRKELSELRSYYRKICGLFDRKNDAVEDIRSILEKVVQDSNATLNLLKMKEAMLSRQDDTVPLVAYRGLNIPVLADKFGERNKIRKFHVRIRDALYNVQFEYEQLSNQKKISSARIGQQKDRICRFLDLLVDLNNAAKDRVLKYTREQALLPGKLNDRFRDSFGLDFGFVSMVGANEDRAEVLLSRKEDIEDLQSLMLKVLKIVSLGTYGRAEKYQEFTAAMRDIGAPSLLVTGPTSSLLGQSELLGKTILSVPFVDTLQELLDFVDRNFDAVNGILDDILGSDK